MPIYHTIKVVVKMNESIYPYLENIAYKANNLYNATLFRIRQVYTGLQKTDASLSDNEKGVFAEIDALLKAKTGFERPTKERPYMSYRFLYHLLYVNHNPDYTCPELPKQAGQQMIRNAVNNMKAFGKSRSDYKKHSDKYTGEPKMPRYKKSGGKSAFFFTNQEVRAVNKQMLFPKTKETMCLPKCVKDGWRLKQVDVNPGDHQIVLSFVFEEPKSIPEKPTNQRICAIDLGVNNFVAMTNNAGLPGRLYKGGLLKHINHQYNEKISKHVSKQTLQTKEKFKPTHKSRNWARKRLSRICDYMHKTAKDIIQYCQTNQIDTLVVGENSYWKQDLKKNKQMNAKERQNFEQIPFNRFKDILQYLCEWNGINFVLQEESYTSKASYPDRDIIPVYHPKDEQNYHFSGIRINENRNFYKPKKDLIINADLNGSANIGRKAFPDLFNCAEKTFFQIEVFRNSIKGSHKKKRNRKEGKSHTSKKDIA